MEVLWYGRSSISGLNQFRANANELTNKQNYFYPSITTAYSCNTKAKIESDVEYNSLFESKLECFSIVFQLISLTSAHTNST